MGYSDLLDRILIDQNGNEGQVVEIDAKTLSVESCDGLDRFATLTIGEVSALEDRAEDFGLEADERLTCHSCQAWATSDHFSSDQHRSL